ncbi:MAG: hypothetical protein ACK4FZ_05075 [Vogesella sp.]
MTLDRLHTFVIKFIRIACEPHGIEVNRDKAPAQHLRRVRQGAA